MRKPSFWRYIEELCSALVGNHYSSHVWKARHMDVNERLQNVGLHRPEFPADTPTGHNCVICHRKHEKFRKANPGEAYKDIPVARAKSCI